MRRHRLERSGAWLGLLLGIGLAGACFNAPQPAVQFSCDQDEAPQCPSGYTCEPDGCCHLDGSDYEANAGACQLGGGALTGAPGSTGATSSASEGSSSDGSSSDGSSSAATSEDASTGSSGATAGSSDSGTTASGTA